MEICEWDMGFCPTQCVFSGLVLSEPASPPEIVTTFTERTYYAVDEVVHLDGWGDVGLRRGSFVAVQ